MDLGAIRQRFARMCDAMRMEVLGHDPFASNLPAFIRPVALETMWRSSDAISLHCPLTPDNRGVTWDAYVNMGVAAARNVLGVLEGQAA